MAKRQTRHLEGVVPAREWRFKSSFGHLYEGVAKRQTR